MSYCFDTRGIIDIYSRGFGLAPGRVDRVGLVTEKLSVVTRQRRYIRIIEAVSGGRSNVTPGPPSAKRSALCYWTVVFCLPRL